MQKNSKVSEILIVATFDTISTLAFDTKCLNHTMETPKVIYSTWPLDDSQKLMKLNSRKTLKYKFKIFTKPNIWHINIFKCCL
jgi:HJR/Mrr/RecB family endonuclease